MKNNEPIRIAVAETSIIVRSGLVSVLKRIPELNVHPIEILSPDTLNSCFRLHTPDILIVNPSFGGWFDLTAFKASANHSKIKCVALLCSVIDGNLLKDYDISLSIYDDLNLLTEKINELLNSSVEEKNSEAETLSQREREIIVCVVKGMTNKTIAEQLFLSIHTVITHRRNIARKLQIHSPAGLTIYAIVNKLVELSEVKAQL